MKRRYDCPYCGPGWKKLPVPPPPPEPPNELLSYWTAIGKEPTEEERIDQLLVDITDLERQLEDVRNDLSGVPALEQGIKNARENLNALMGRRPAASEGGSGEPR